MVKSLEIWPRIYDSIPDAICILDTRYRMLYLNEAMRTLIGGGKERLLGTTCHEAVCGRKGPAEDCPMTRMLESRKRESGEVTPRDRVYEVTADPIINDDGALLGAFHVLSDITGRTEAEAALNESLERYETLFSSAGDSIFIMDRYRFIECNEATLEMYGCDDRSDILGRHPWDFSPKAQPDGSNSMKRARELIDRALEGEVQRFRWEHTRKDGTPFTAEVVLNRLELGGKESIQAIVRDVTERDRAEAELNRYADLLQDTQKLSGVGGWEYDVRTGRNSWTDEVYSIYGVPEDFDIDDLEKTAGFFVDRDGDSVLAAFRRCADRGEPYDMEVRFANALGRELWVRMLGEPVVEDGKVVKVRGNFMDITEARAAVEAVKGSEEKYRRLVEGSPDVVYIYSKERGALFWSARAGDILGYTQDDLTATPMLWYDSIHPDDLPAVDEAIGGAGEGKPFDIEYRIKDAKGKWKWLRDRSITVHMTEDDVIIDGIATDITQSKLAKDEVRLQRDRAETYLALAGVMMLALDNEGKVTMINRKGCEILGMAENEIVGREWFSNFIPKGVRGELGNLFNHIVSDNLSEAEHIENPVLNAKGEERLIRWYNTVLQDLDGKVTGTLSSGEDITEQRRAEEWVLKERDRARMYLNLAGVMFVALDREGKVTLINPRGCAILGGKEGDIIGRDWFDTCVPPKTRKTVRMVFDRIMKGEIRSVESYENPVLNAKGEERMIAWHNTVLTGEDGTIVGTLSSGEDITERQEAEKARQEAGARFRLLFENMGEGHLHLDLDGIIVDANPKLCEISGYSRDELVGKDILDLVGIFGLDPDVMGPLFIEMTSGEKSEISEWSILNKEGEARTLRVHPSIIVKEGEPEGLSIIIGDITELKEAREERERFSTAVRMSTEGVAILDLDTEVVDVNDAMVSMLGYTSRDEMLGMNGLEMLASGQLDKAQANLLEVLSGESLENLEYNLSKKSGDEIMLEVGVTTMKDQTGEPTGIVIICRDITERKRRELEMRRALMSFDMSEGNLYLVKEDTPSKSLGAIRDLIKVGYKARVLSRTPGAEFPDDLLASSEHLWISETGDEGCIRPAIADMEAWAEGLPRKQVIFIDRLDFIYSRNGARDTIGFIQRLRDLAHIKDHTVILSMDPATVDDKELRMLEKETRELVPVHRTKLPEDLFDVLRYVYNENLSGRDPSHTEICSELDLSKPTVRKRLKELLFSGYVKESVKGSKKVISVTEKGRRPFSKQ